MRQTYYQAYKQVLESERAKYLMNLNETSADDIRPLDLRLNAISSDVYKIQKMYNKDTNGIKGYIKDVFSSIIRNIDVTNAFDELYRSAMDGDEGALNEFLYIINPIENERYDFGEYSSFGGKTKQRFLKRMLKYLDFHNGHLDMDECYEYINGVANESVNESKRGSISKTVEVENRQVKPYRVKRTVGSMNKPMNQRVEQEFVPKTQKDRKTEQDPSNHIIRASQNGIPVDSKARDFIRAKDLNAKFRGKVVSPFYKQKENSKNPLNSGIFSEDENSVCAALSDGIPSNKPVRSKLLSRRSIYEKGLVADDFVEDVGMVDALTWQCWNGNYTNVKQILKNGYDAPKSYSGMNPITASVDGRNIECLKIVLSVPKILDLVNSKDGFGNYPLECTTKIKGIDPYEFAKILVEAGARDDERTGKDYNAAMLSLLNGTWTPNLFGELLPVTDLEHKTKDGLDLRSLAEKLGNREAVLMIDNFKKYGDESINQSVTHSLLISHI